MNEKMLSEDFIEDAYSDISNFEVFALQEGYSSQTIMSLVDNITRVLENRNQSEYDAVNKIIMYTSSYQELQQLLLSEFLYPTITNTYLKEIDKDPKRVLYFLSRNSIHLRGNAIDTLLQPLKEFARDKILLDSSSKNKKYEPEFIGENLDLTALTPPELREAKMTDLLNQEGLKNISVIEDYIRAAVVNSKSGTRAKGIIPVFKAIENLGLISEGYAEVYTRPRDLSLFISKITTLNFGKDDIINWTPGSLKSSKYAQDELEKHKIALKKLLIKFKTKN
ncbi:MULTISPECIES: hypothetical protein [Sphingobacterium]|uniref:hypothetical protein n=1 Tax=Sphingobacterium TaxID=28453 RepID=UPI00257CC985|nr:MULTISPECIES: hypothetical protein [Sphingobacterium]